MSRTGRSFGLTVAILMSAACTTQTKFHGEGKGTGSAGEAAPAGGGAAERERGDYALKRRDASVVVGDAFRPCADDDDCALVDIDCNGCCNRDAIAERLESEFTQSFTEACRGYRGAICDCSYLPLTPRCVDSKCRAVRTEPAGGYQLQRRGENVVITPAYRACEQDSECTLVATSCAGCCERDAISSSLEGTYAEHFGPACADYRGPQCDCDVVPADARCIDAVCTHVALSDGR